MLRAIGREFPTHATWTHKKTASYFYPQNLFKNEAGDHRENKEQPDPVDFVVTEEVNATLGIIDGNRLDRAIVWQRGFRRTEWSFPEMAPQPHGRDLHHIGRDIDILCHILPTGSQL